MVNERLAAVQTTPAFITNEVRHGIIWVASILPLPISKLRCD